MKLIKILHCDAIHSVKEATVTSSKEQLKSDPILSKFADIFEGLGKLDGYNSHCKSPTQATCGTMSVVKTELNTIVSKEIIAPVTEPTPLVSSMVVMQKKNGTFNTLFGRFIDRDRCPLALAVPLKFGNNE